MKDLKNVFRKLEKKLSSSSWFDENWEIYNRGCYLQVYKTNWYNQNQGGVHFETFIEGPQIRSKNFPICMHAEDDCPSRDKFIERFFDISGSRLEDLKGFKTIPSGYSLCERVMPLNFKNLELRIYEELNKLRKMEDAIDEALLGLDF